jgi:hypothetical protein
MSSEQSTHGPGRTAAAAVAGELARRVAADPEGTVDAVIRWIRQAHSSLVDEKPVEQDVLTFADAMRFFAANKAQVRGAKSGAILRTQHDGCQLIRLLFLDETKHPLVANAPMAFYSVLDVDDELRSAFGAHDLIIVN